MKNDNQYMFVVRIRFEEKKRHLLGYAIVIGDARQQKIFKCLASVQYFSEKLFEQSDMLSSWNDYLLLVRRGHNKMDDEFLKGFAMALQERVESYEPERVDRLADTIGMVTDPKLKSITLETIFKEDLQAVFPSSDLSMDVLTETVFHKSKQKVKKSTGEKTKNKADSPAVMETGPAAVKDSDASENGSTDSEGTSLPPVSKKEDSSEKKGAVEDVKVATQESASPDTPVNEAEDKPLPDVKAAHKPLPNAKDNVAKHEEKKEKKKDEASSLVDLRVDPINGLAARLLKVNDIVVVTRSSGFKAAARVTSVEKDPAELDYLKVTMCLDNNVTGQSVIFKNALVAVEREEIAPEIAPIYHKVLVYGGTMGTVMFFLCYLAVKILTGGF